MTIPNVNTSETAIINQIVAELRTLPDANDMNVFLSAVVEWLDTPPGDWYVEIIPGVAQDRGTKEEVGMVDDSFTVCLFWRLYADPAQRDTIRIADASLGALQFVRRIEDKLTNSFLAGLALVPILPNRRDSFERAPLELPGWVMVRRAFTFSWLWSFPSRQSVS